MEIFGRMSIDGIKKANISFENILPVILALLLIFIIPMLMRRYGMEPGDMIRILMTRFRKQDYAAVSREKRNAKKGNREPWQANDRSNELKTLIASLLMFVRKNGFGLIYPGTVARGNEIAGLVAFVVTKKEVIGLNCFGYGGSVSEKNGKWFQHINGVNQEITDPMKGNETQYRLVRRVMDEDGMEQIPLRIMAVFTNRSVTLSTKHPKEAVDVEKLFSYLHEQASDEEGRVDPEEISRKLNAHVKRIRRGKKI